MSMINIPFPETTHLKLALELAKLVGYEKRTALKLKEWYTENEIKAMIKMNKMKQTAYSQEHKDDNSDTSMALHGISHISINNNY